MDLLNKLINKKPKAVVEQTTKAAEEAKTPAETKTQEGRPFVEGLVSTKDIIAPAALEVDFDDIRIGNKYYRSLFVAGYPRFVGINWLSPLINFDASQNISMYIYPTDGKEILDDLRRKIAEMEAEISTDIQRGRVVNPATQAKLEDALNLQADLVKGEERFFQFGLYITVSAETKDELNRITKNLEASLGSLLIISKKSTLQMEEGFVTTLPICSDRINITRNMDTTSLASTFPFVSSDLSDDKGIMYGINEHNGSLVIFDRFSMPNYNSVVFATAGAGKSYLIKLEAIRSLMMGTEIIVIDPENEYKNLAEAAGGQYIAFGYGEDSKINPFDLSLVEEEGENALNSKILSLHKLFTVMLGTLDPMEESILDRALMDAYKMKGVTPDPATQSKEPPLIEDLYKALIGMEEEKARILAAKLEKYIKGSFAGIFNQKTTVNLNNKFVVFGIRNLEETLRPVAMHIILDYIWTVVKKSLKRRILVVDEAWYMMQYQDSASFLRGIVKRGRKYYLGVTTITQDVDDFLQTPYGKEIVTNSSIQILLKQHSAAIDQVGEVFYLSEGEKQLLLTADKGEGIFFAGQNHVAIKIIASEDEHKLITSNPEEVLKMKQAGKVPTAEIMKPEKTAAPPVTSSEEVEEEMEAAPKFAPPSIKPMDQGGVVVSEPALPPRDKPVLNTAPVLSPTAAVTPAVSVPPAPIGQNMAGVNQAATQVKPTIEPEVNQKQTEPAVKTENAAVEGRRDFGFKTEVISGTEEALQQKIKEMEDKEKITLEEHQKKMEEEKRLQEEEKKKMVSGLGSLGGGLPKYQDLFKAPNPSGALPKLPPLPPLPKFENKSTNLPAKTDTPIINKGGNIPFKTEVVGDKKPVNKPLFINQAEVKVPQPPQLQKKPKAEFVAEPKKEEPKETAKVEPVKPQTNSPKPVVENAKPDENGGKLDYDKLFGDGIV